MKRKTEIPAVGTESIAPAPSRAPYTKYGAITAIVLAVLTLVGQYLRTMQPKGEKEGSVATAKASNTLTTNGNNNAEGAISGRGNSGNSNFGNSNSGNSNSGNNNSGTIIHGPTISGDAKVEGGQIGTIINNGTSKPVSP